MAKEKLVSGCRGLCFSGDSLESLASNLQAIRDSAELERWQNECIEVDDNEVVVTYMRPETEHERTTRELCEQKIKARKAKSNSKAKAAERKLYEKLKKKFGE